MFIFETTTGKKLTKIEDHFVQNQGQLNAHKTANTVKWHTSDSILCVNSESVERLFKLVKKAGKYSLLEKGFCKIPYFRSKEISDYHFYDERRPLQESQVQESLRRMYHNYKRATLVFDGMVQKDTLSKIKAVHEHMYKLDYGSQDGGYLKRPQIKTSFTYIDWKIAEMIKSDLRVENIND